ncbi:HD domain-containing protein [Polynucleobacter sp. 71A-WALBACH]|uniref:HD domain-containing phosphohydrolase n=1 Tax=Polynucleobacter sp. 71A-WALBACH TaxID=2689097 RepID=UPI001C0E6200|nr:HD domain-containing phosphohydrolase [Polynucleobacter sp. 71A-WALBACH]MBU3593703.1 HD domain-containing protein [Polynucleobacter sp. 71A-WALBACH]
MALANQLFYFSFAAVMLVMFIGVIKRTDTLKQSVYLSISLGLTALAGFGFALAGITPVFLLSLGNTGLVFSGLAVILFIRSWDPDNKDVDPRYFWFAFFIFLIGYEFLRIFASFSFRVYLMTGLVGALSLMGLVETFLAPKEGKRLQFNILKIAFIVQFLLLVIRALNTTYGLTISTVFQEEVFAATLRMMAMGSVLLIFLSINNILFERLLGHERKKAIDSELKMLSSLNALALARDNETGAHIVRTQEYVKCLARRLRSQGDYEEALSDEDINLMHKAAPLHDIGKVGIPDGILYKKGALTSEEWGVMKTHAYIGENILTSAKAQLPDIVGRDVIDVAIEIAAAHHEQWDGGGYPRGLKGAEIPLSARIMALADMYDALISERVYKSGWSHDEAVAEILRKRGTHFDPVVVEAFATERDRFQAIAQRHRDLAGESRVFSEAVDTFERKLHRSEEKFEFLFKCSPIGMAMVDYLTGKFVEVNDALLAYTKYSKEEFLKLSFWDITPGEYQNQEEAQLEDLRKKGSFGPNRKEYIRKDGTRFPISIRGFILTDVDSRKLVWGIIEDLSPHSLSSPSLIQ